MSDDGANTQHATLNIQHAERIRDARRWLILNNENGNNTIGFFR